VVCPRIAPSWTLQNFGSPSQPLRLLPSKSFFSAKMEEIKKKEDRMIGDIFIIS
jgi:hypothetical protein